MLALGNGFLPGNSCSSQSILSKLLNMLWLRILFGCEVVKQVTSVREAPDFRWIKEMGQKNVLTYVWERSPLNAGKFDRKTKLCNFNSVYLGIGVLTNSSYILHGHILKELCSPNQLMIIIEMPQYITAFPPAFRWLERGRCRWVFSCRPRRARRESRQKVTINLTLSCDLLMSIKFFWTVIAHLLNASLVQKRLQPMWAKNTWLRSINPYKRYFFNIWQMQWYHCFPAHIWLTRASGFLRVEYEGAHI